MSGGRLDYVYCKVSDAADSIEAYSKHRPLWLAFAEHLRLVSKALHDCEWVLSSDYGSGDEKEVIRACLAPGVELEAAIKEAKVTQEHLEEAITYAKMTFENPIYEAINEFNADHAKGEK